MIRSCDTCGVVAFDSETGVCEYCVAVAASEARKAAAAGNQPTGGSDDLLKGAVPAVAEAIATIGDVAQLDALAVSERAGKNRKGVLDAISARKTTLEAVA